VAEAQEADNRRGRRGARILSRPSLERTLGDLSLDTGGTLSKLQGRKDRLLAEAQEGSGERTPRQQEREEGNGERASNSGSLLTRGASTAGAAELGSTPFRPSQRVLEPSAAPGGAAVNIRLGHADGNGADDDARPLLEPVVTARYPATDHPDRMLTPLLPQFCHPHGVDALAGTSVRRCWRRRRGASR
jgi:hypothetical protein